MNSKDAYAACERSRAPIGEIPIPLRPGTYMLFLNDGADLSVYVRDEDRLVGIPSGLVYVGISSNLAGRQHEHHFKAGETGWSSPRRTFGALLKKALQLTAIPRELNARRSKFKFTVQGELKLSKWMRTNLEVGVAEIPDISKDMEGCFIRECEPALNLNKWTNPLRKGILNARALCATEAYGPK